jgi:hypothetical protein
MLVGKLGQLLSAFRIQIKVQTVYVGVKYKLINNLLSCYIELILSFTTHK